MKLGPKTAWVRAGALVSLFALLVGCAPLAGDVNGAEDAISEAEIEALANIAPAAGAMTGALSPERAALFVKQLGDRVIGAMADRSLASAQRVRTLRHVLRVGFDLDAISRIVLGRYWNNATPVQRTEYRRLFEELVVAIYVDRFRKYSGEALTITGAHLSKRKIVVVNSFISRPRGGKQPMGVDWLVRNTEAGPRIIDVIVGGVSMAITQRSEFASIIRGSGGGVEGLLVELRAKTG